jgi:lipopolysaccharide export LptBFGC system permease protein LptF
MRKKRSRLVLLVAVVLIIIVIVTVTILVYLGSQSSQLVAGVKAGDTFTYTLQGLWESDDPNATISDNILQMNMTESFQVAITNVSGTEISIHTVWRFKNETEIEGDDKVDIATGISNGGFWAIYAANLNKGQIAHAIGPEPAAIVSTVNKQYISSKRETNVLIMSAQFQNTEDPSRVYTDTRVVQFDKKTGMLVELRNAKVYNIPEMTETIVWELVDSNVWTVT